MNKTELVAAMADQAGLSKNDTEKALNRRNHNEQNRVSCSYG